MFDPAIAAGSAAAATWTPDGPEPGAAQGCCRLCFHRYRVLVLDGPLQGLPHAVAHAVVQGVDDLIRARVPIAPEASEGRGSARRDAATGALLVVALEELGAAGTLLADLRRRFTEPAVGRYIEQHRAEDRVWTEG